MNAKTDHPRNKGGLSQNHNFYKKINLDGFIGEWRRTSGGKPTFPTPSLSKLSFKSSMEGVQGGFSRTNHSISQVGKVGLPPLVCYGWMRLFALGWRPR